MIKNRRKQIIDKASAKLARELLKSLPVAGMFFEVYFLVSDVIAETKSLEQSADDSLPQSRLALA